MHDKKYSYHGSKAVVRLKPCYFNLHDMVEIWKDIEDFEGHYQVSNLGKVKSLKRLVPHLKSGTKTINEKILSQCIDSRGYYQVNLKVEGLQKLKRVHRLMSMAFIPNPQNKPEVNHINGIKHDNNLENLEWVDKSENMIHALKLGLKPPVVGVKGEKSHNAKINEVDAIFIKYNSKNIPVKNLSIKYKISIGAIYHIRKGISWKHI